jgi:type IV pilus assembly protein PilC
MKTFLYKAKKDSEIINGSMIASGTQDVVNRLAQEGYIATYVGEEASWKNGTLKYSLKGLFGVRLKNIISFSKQLAALLKSGVPILKSLYILSEQAQTAYIKNIVEDIADKVKNGRTLSSSMNSHPKVFSPFYVAMVNAGEESGSLDVSLIRITEYYTRQADFVSKVKSALAYPILILIVGVLTVLFIFTHVIPRIIPLLLDLNVKLPLPTQILIGTSTFIKNNWFYILLTLLTLALIAGKATKNRFFKEHFSAFKLKVPFLGDFIFKSEFARFARALETSLESGIPIIKAMDISLQILNEPVIKGSLTKSLKELESGGSLGSTLKASRIFSPFVVTLVSIGEESGRLDEMLSDIASSFEADCEEYVKIITTLLEPIMVLVIGLVVGFIVSAVLLPIFQLNVMHL